MPLKNYTSTIPASRSIAYIEACLAQHGAREILKQYDEEQRVVGICFRIMIQGQILPFRLPSRVRECEQVLESELSRRARPETRKKIPAQAERTAWKILSDWVEAQVAMIDLAQVDLVEVFLPYLYDGKQTFYETARDRQFAGLLGPGVTP